MMLLMEAQEYRRDSSIIIVQWWRQFLGQNWLERLMHMTLSPAPSF